MSQEKVGRTNGAAFEDQGPDGLIHRGFLRGVSRDPVTVGRRPVIGIANTWSELNPCNDGLRDLAVAVKEGVSEAGGTALEFPTISLAEAYIRPSSMYLRNLMSMDTEEMITASPIDGVVLLGGCDKTLPAQLMGALSAGKPAIALAAGPRPLSEWKGSPMSVDELWPLIDERRAGRMDHADWRRLESCLSCGAGTCNVMGTATTMAVVAEVMGMALPGSALPAAASPRRMELARETGRRAVDLAINGITPDQLITPVSLANAFRAVCAVGGSTNALLHLQAIAGRIGHRLKTAQLRRISRETPLLADVKPSGSKFLHDFENDGGVPALMRRLAPLLGKEELDAKDGAGRSWRESIHVEARTNDKSGDTIASTSPQPCLRTLDEPAGPPDNLVLLKGSLAPSGAILKRSAATPALTKHTGRAVVFEGVEDLNNRINDPALDVEEDSVLVLRYAGPLGGPGMPEVGHLPIPLKLLEHGVTDMVRISDARMSGTATGTVVLHVAPEAAVGGPLALVHNGDRIRLDADNESLELLVDAEELSVRRAALPQTVTSGRGYEGLYRKHVMQADAGCDFDILQASMPEAIVEAGLDERGV